LIQMPKGALTTAARRNLKRFQETAAARELEDDPRTWRIVEWSWVEGPPLRVHLRCDRGEVVDFVMDEAGVWRMQREPIESKVQTPSDLGLFQ
jgi:hypothetical protein